MMMIYDADDDADDDADADACGGGCGGIFYIGNIIGVICLLFRYWVYHMTGGGWKAGQCSCDEQTLLRCLAFSCPKWLSKRSTRSKMSKETEMPKDLNCMFSPVKLEEFV